MADYGYSTLTKQLANVDFKERIDIHVVYNKNEPKSDPRPECAGYDQPGDTDERKSVEIPAVSAKCPMCGNDFLKEDVGFPMALLCCCASKSKRKVWKTCVYCGVRF